MNLYSGIFYQGVNSMNSITKRLLSITAACTLCFSASPLTANADTYYYKGDVNNSGTVDVADVTAITQYLRGILSADGVYAERLDVNRDYVIDDKDLQEIKKIVIGTAQTKSVRSVNTEMTTGQEATSYRKYDAQTGASLGTYGLMPVPNISASRSANTRNIIGDDDRVIDYSKSGIVKLNYDKIDSTTSEPQGYNATGFIVGNHTIVTAAHCVNTAFNVRCTLYNSDGTVNAVYNAVNYHLPQKFISGFGGAEYDYAVITVAEDLSSYKCFNIGVCRDNLKNINPDIYVTGLSGDPSPSKPQLNGNIVTGSGKFTKNVNNDTILPKVLHYNTDMVGGTSGGPIYVKDSNGVMTVIGINTGADPVCNFGRRIDSNVLHFIYNNDELN